MSKKCRKKGCKGYSIKDDTKCYFHSEDPKIIRKRKRSSGKGGRNSRRGFEKKNKQITEKDLAQRIMILQGGDVKKKTKLIKFSDEQLMNWVGSIKGFQKFCKDLLILNGKPLKLQPYQIKLARMWEDNHYSIAVTGRQVGKSLTVSAYTLWKSITDPNHFTTIISPTDRQSKELFKKIITFCALNDQLYDSVVNPKVDEVSFTNGSRTVSLPGRGSITGYTDVDQVIIDEAGLPELPDKVYANATPMLAKKHGKLILLGTPKGKATKFYEYTNNPMFAKFHVPTSENKHIKEVNKFLESEKKRCSVIEYNQEYEGIFQDLEGTFIPSRYIDASVDDYDYVLQSREDKRYYCGIDWGRFGDQTVIVVISEFQEKIKVEYVRAFSGEPLQKARAHVEYLNTVFSFTKVIPEYNGLSIPVVDEMKDMNVEKFTSTNESKFEGYANLRKLFEDERITIPAQESKMITQLRYLEMSQTPSGKTRIAHKSGQHDDYADALMLACYGIMEDGSIDLDLFMVE